MIAIEGTHHRADDGKRTNTIEQNARGKSLRQVGFGEAIDQTVEAAIEVEHRADHTTYRKANNEKDGILALGKVITHGIEAQRQGGQSHGGKHHLLILLLDAPFGKVPHAATHDNRDRIDYGPYHK